MINQYQIEDLTEYIEEKMLAASDETKIVLEAVLLKIRKMKSPAIHLIRVSTPDGRNGFINTKNASEDYFEWSDTNSTLFESLEDAEEWELKIKNNGWKTEIKSIDKQNVRVGDEFYDYCNGFFGRDYGNKRIIEVGPNYLIAELEDGTHYTATFEDGWQIKYMPVLIESWRREL
jgi:hypothetical protein